MKILIINGSHRKGNTDIVIEKLNKILVQTSSETRILNLRDIEMKIPDGCEICGESGICPNIYDQFSKEIEPSIRDFDIYIIVTPTWDDGVTPLTKIFWDRIVSWCHKDRMYLRNKKLAIITHGMAGKTSWDNVINWVKSVCVWEECKFAGSLTFKSGSKIGDIELDDSKIKEFVDELLK
ncbi:MAG: flavodoxin family protein [bacterium]|nr:flavodoxin family protein [bacterium]